MSVEIRELDLGAKGVVSRTGSGFHDGPSTVDRSRWRISRPQMIHAHGSYVGEFGPSSVSAAIPRQASTSAFHGRGAALAASASRSRWTEAAGVRRVRRAATDTPGIMPSPAAARM